MRYSWLAFFFVVFVVGAFSAERNYVFLRGDINGFGDFNVGGGLIASWLDVNAVFANYYVARNHIDLNVIGDINASGSIKATNFYGNFPDVNTQFVPYFGATQDANLGNNAFSVRDINVFRDLNVVGKINTTQIFNRVGNLKLEPNANGNITCFEDTVVRNDVDGNIFYVYRNAAEGVDSFALYIDQYRRGTIAASSSGLQITNTGYIQISSDTSHGSTSPLQLNPGSNSDVTVFDSASSGEIDNFSISGYRSGDALRTLSISIGKFAPSVASFYGIGNFSFAGDMNIVRDVNVGRDLNVGRYLFATKAAIGTNIIQIEPLWVGGDFRATGDVYGTNSFMDIYYAGGTGGITDNYDDGTDTIITFKGGIATAVSTAYDERLMKNVSYLSEKIDPITQLSPVSFQWNNAGLRQFSDANKRMGIQNGYKAQDVQRFYPSCIVPKEMNLTGTATIYLQYNKNCIDVMMALKLQEKENEIETMKADINALKTKAGIK